MDLLTNNKIPSWKDEYLEIPIWQEIVFFPLVFAYIKCQIGEM